MKFKTAILLPPPLLKVALRQISLCKRMPGYGRQAQTTGYEGTLSAGKKEKLSVGKKHLGEQMIFKAA